MQPSCAAPVQLANAANSCGAVPLSRAQRTVLLHLGDDGDVPIPATIGSVSPRFAAKRRSAAAKRRAPPEAAHQRPRRFFLELAVTLQFLYPFCVHWCRVHTCGTGHMFTAVHVWVPKGLPAILGSNLRRPSNFGDLIRFMADIWDIFLCEMLRP
jgi:hypothetical protein